LISSKIQKIAYVDLKEVYNDFKMTKELESSLTNVQAQRKRVLDSLGLRLQLFAKSIDNTPEKERTSKMQQLEAGKQEYFAQKQQFDQDDQNTVRKYNEEVWKQLNQYVKEYGKEHHYTYVLGGDGTGALMYGDDAVNITNEAKVYVNSRYKGGVK